MESIAGAVGLNFAELYNFDPYVTAGIVCALAAVWTLPNSQQWLRNYPTALDAGSAVNWFQTHVTAAVWKPTAGAGVVIGLVGFFALLRAISAAPTEFLYFQF